MVSPLSAYLKIIRAEEHLAVLKAEIDTFKQLNTHVGVGEMDNDFGFLVRVRQTETLSVRPRLIAGDCIHNMRAALDHLAWQLVRAAGNEPRIEPPSTQFPIFDSPPKNGKPATIFGGVTDEAAALVDALQPYKRGDEASAHPLSRLRELDNIDKHRHVHFTIALSARTSCMIRDPKSQTVLGGQPQPGPFLDGDPIAWFPGVRSGDDMEVYVKGATLVSLPEASGGVTSVEAVDALFELCQFVREDVLDRFARTCF